MVEKDSVNLNSFYNVEILRACCKGNQAATGDYHHLLRFDRKAVTVHGERLEVRTVAFLNLSPKANNTNDEHLQQGDGRIVDDKVRLLSYGVPWVLNSQSPRCMRCLSAFSAYNWRHHCRLCGYLVCAHCSRSQVSIIVLLPSSSSSTPSPAKQISLEPNGSRVCLICYENKGGPDAITYTTNPVGRLSFSGQSAALVGQAVAAPLPPVPAVRRPSGGHVDSLVTPARRSFVHDPAWPRSPSPSSSIAAPMGPNPLQQIRRHSERNFSTLAATPDRPTGGIAMYPESASATPSEKAKRLSVEGQATPSIEVDKEKKARLIQKFQEAKEEESRLFQERVQSHKRDPSRQVSGSTKSNPFVVQDHRLQESGIKTNQQEAVEERSVDQEPFAEESKENENTANLSPVTPSKSTAARGLKKVFSSTDQMISASEERERLESRSEDHQANEENRPLREKNLFIQLADGLSTPQPSTVAAAQINTVQTNKTESTITSTVSDLTITPVNLNVLGSPETGRQKVAFTAQYGLWEAESDGSHSVLKGAGLTSPYTPTAHRHGSDDFNISVNDFAIDADIEPLSEHKDFHHPAPVRHSLISNANVCIVEEDVSPFEKPSIVSMPEDNGFFDSPFSTSEKLQAPLPEES
eukprot:gene7757-8568_t